MYGIYPILNAPGQEVISDEEVVARIRVIENARVELNREDSKHLSTENLEKCYGLLEI